MNKSLSFVAALFPAVAAAQSYMTGPDFGASEPTPKPLNAKEFKYFFKTPVIKDEEGKEIGKGEKHPDVTGIFPVPSAAELIEALSFAGETVDGDGKTPTVRAKVAGLLLEAVADLIKDAGKVQINEFMEKNADNPAARFSATMFDMDRLTLEFIASQDKAARGAWAPSDEDIKVFNEDYTTVFVHEVQYDPKRVKVHCDQFTKGFVKIKADKLALQKMKDFLVVFASKTANMDSLASTYGWLIARIDKYMKAEEKNYSDAL